MKKYKKNGPGGQDYISCPIFSTNLPENLLPGDLPIGS